MIKLGKTMILVTAAVAMAALLMIGLAEATPLAPNPDSPDLVMEGPGLTIAAGGVGLSELGGDTGTISIDIGGPVQQAILYWGGRQTDCDLDEPTGPCEITLVQPYRDQEIIFDGNPITGTIIGTEFQTAGDRINVGYNHDVTDIVQDAFSGPGVYGFDIQDGNINSNLLRLDGAGLLVIYTDESDPENYRVILFEGADLAFCSTCGVGDDRNDTDDGNLGVDPVTFKYDAEGFNRFAQLALFVGDAEAGRPDLVRISDNPDLVNELNSSEGPEFDVELLNNIDVLAGVSETTVQLFSQRTPTLGTEPDSMLWLLGALRIPVTVPDPDIDIRKQEEGPDSRTFPSGSDVDFEIVVTNTGDVDLTDVAVTDDQVPGCAQSIGDLAVGASHSYTCTAPDVTESFTNEACATGQFGAVTVEDCDPSTVEITPVGGEGCTPGYWRQAHHFDSWEGYTPGKPFSDVFDREITVGAGRNQVTDPTLLQALEATGGGVSALARHAVAALLNAASSGVDYAFTEDEVIMMVQDAIDSGNVEATKDDLEAENELGCPLD